MHVPAISPGAWPSRFRHQETFRTPHLPTLTSQPGSRQNPEGNTPCSRDKNHLPTLPWTQCGRGVWGLPSGSVSVPEEGVLRL